MGVCTIVYFGTMSNHPRLNIIIGQLIKLPTQNSLVRLTLAVNWQQLFDLTAKPSCLSGAQDKDASGHLYLSIQS
jgi:hypothetical protein